MWRCCACLAGKKRPGQASAGVPTCCSPWHACPGSALRMLSVPAGLGPVFVAFFIQRLGRTGAFNLSTAGWIPCGLLLMGTGEHSCLPPRPKASSQTQLFIQPLARTAATS